MSKVQAVILAGGQGSRLRPYTTILPKPLMPVGELPIAEIIVRQLARAGLTHIAISTGHLAELIEAYFADGKRWGVHIQYIREDRPMGTAGALQFVENLTKDFLVINGDILTDLDFGKLMKVHAQKRAAATIAIAERIVKTDFGVIETGPDGALQDYIKKPAQRLWVSTGINVLSSRCLKFLKKNEPLGMPELMLRLKAAGEPVRCFKTRGYWLDLGRREDLDLAQEVFEQNQKKFLKGS